MNVALVHYWLVNMRGGEKVLEALGDLFPGADLYTHVYDPDAVSDRLRRHDVETTFVGRLPGARRHYQKYLALMPLALEQLDLGDYDLVVSSESGPAKGVLTPPDTLHVCYCHSPMRYAWDLYHDYRADAGLVARTLMPPVMHYLRLWDRASADRVDRFVANSENVRGRIRKHYRREAEVVHPPVDTEYFTPDGDPATDPATGRSASDPYLFVGQLIPYKRPDLAVEAFARMPDRELLVVGSGARERRLRRRAGPNVTFAGRLSGDDLRDAYRSCRALLFPGEEDFGIVPVEAMATGRPVIAYRAGGATETVVEGESGLFFDEQDPGALVDAVERFEERSGEFRPGRIRAHAEAFGRERFKERMETLLEGWLRAGRPSAGG